MNTFGKVGRSLSGFAIAILLPLVQAGCKKKDASPRDGRGEDSPDAFPGIGADTKPEVRKNLMAAKPFVSALAGRKYGEAYSMLSSHAKARMSLNQFVPGQDDAAIAGNEKNPMRAVTAEQFGDLMKKVEAVHGVPRKPKDLSVFSTDPDVLNRRSKAEFGAMDSMFAIGAMPDSIPADIRRASLRGQISTELSAPELEKVAKVRETTVEALKKDPDFDPYLNFKIVLVEEDGQLKVGYFEFLPPSMLD